MLTPVKSHAGSILCWTETEGGKEQSDKRRFIELGRCIVFFPSKKCASQKEGELSLQKGDVIKEGWINFNQMVVLY